MTERRDVARKIYAPYMKSTLQRKVRLLITEIGKNIKQNLETKLNSNISGKCIQEGFIKPKSIKVIQYSSGNISFDQVHYDVIFDCMVCIPVEGMLVECTCKTVTKAGIHAEVIDDDGVKPLTIFVARDHHHMDERLNKLNEGDKIVVTVIGIRFELNDTYICAIAKLNQSTNEAKPKVKPRLQMGGDLEEVLF